MRPEEVGPLVEGANSSEVRSADGLKEVGLQEVVHASELGDGLEDVAGLDEISGLAEDPELDHAAEVDAVREEEEVGRLEEATPRLDDGFDADGLETASVLDDVEA